MSEDEIIINIIYCESEESGERWRKTLLGYKNVRAEDAELRIGHDSCIQVPGLSTSRGFKEGEMGIGFFLSFLEEK